MTASQKTTTTKRDEKLPAFVQLWILRLLVPLQGYQKFWSKYGFENTELAAALGYSKYVENEANEIDEKFIIADLKQKHKVFEKTARPHVVSRNLEKNITRLSSILGLTDTDRRILEFSIFLQSNHLLKAVAGYHENVSSTKLNRILSVVLDIPESSISNSLKIQNTLVKSGMITVFGGLTNLEEKINLLTTSIADHLFEPDLDPINLLKNYLYLGSPAQLNISNFSHIESSLSILLPYIKHALMTKRAGVNIFIHGKPGTGKSELAKLLAKEHGCELFVVSSEDEDGDSICGEARLRSFRAAQRFLTNRKALILFDEVEDVFNSSNRFFGGTSIAQSRKAWMNRILEENPVPTIWISNSINGLDPAFIRRFDMVVNLPIPPKKQREQILLDTCSDLLNQNQVKRFAESESLAPAVLSRAASVIRSISADVKGIDISCSIEMLLNNTLEAQGNKPIRKDNSARISDIYDPSFICADTNLADVAIGLLANKSGRICLFGPPGTGKTAYGHWLSEQLSIPIHIKRASDLMSMWVGGNEKNIAQSFKQAEDEGALLLVDEVDSFLQDRRGGQRSWEISLVNEMLTQMETFPGIFIATTNLINGLDQAALRRFDLKVKFDFLKLEQVCELLRRYCSNLSLSSPESEEMSRISRLRNLTPGDFATIYRRNKFQPIKRAVDFIEALESECAMKERSNISIGFLQ